MHWVPAPFATKTERSDANYKRLLDGALDPDREWALRVGVAGHNLFDIALGAALGRRTAACGTASSSRCCEGMAPAQAAGGARERGAACCCTRRSSTADEFDVGHRLPRAAARREGAEPDNFMSATSSPLTTDERTFERERRRFRASLAGARPLHTAAASPAGPSRPARRRASDGTTDATTTFANTPDTDPSLAAEHRLGTPDPGPSRRRAPSETTSSRARPSPTPAASTPQHRGRRRGRTGLGSRTGRRTCR